MTEILIIVAVVVLLGLIIGFGFIAPRNRRGSLESPSKRRAPVDNRVVPAEEAARDAFVEAEVVRRLVDTQVECAGCARRARFQYGIESDGIGARVHWSPVLVCGIACLRGVE